VIPWSKPVFGRDEKEAVNRVLDSGWLTMGKETELFEKKLRKVTKKKYNIAVNSGTNTIIGALLAHGGWNPTVKKHIPAYIFPATENAIFASGGGSIQLDSPEYDIIHHDINPFTGHMIPPEITWRQKHDIYIPVSYAGLPLNPEEWKHVPNIIEDGAESLGMDLIRVPPVRFDWDVCYSFHAAKLITTIEGGAVSTDNPDTEFKLRAIRKHGEHPEVKGVFIQRGLNLKPSDINSAIGSVQLDKLELFLWNRNRIAEIYKEEIGERVEYQEVPNYVKKHPYMMFPIFVDSPTRLHIHLKKHQIDTRLGWKPLKPLSNSTLFSKRVICLPIYNNMTEDEVIEVSRRVVEWTKL